MSRICTLPLALRQFTVKSFRINSSNRQLSYSARLLAQNLTSNLHNEFHNRQKNGIISLGTQQNLYSSGFGNKYSWRSYATNKPPPQSSSSGNDDNSMFNDEDLDDMFSDDCDDEQDETVKNVPSIHIVPEYFPKVPLIATSYPVFPKFMKVFEVTDPKLIKILEWKLSVKQPFAGVFMLKTPDTTNNVSMVKNLDDCHKVGTFVKITEINKTDGKLQFVATAHRRIEIEKQLKSERVSKPSADKKVRKLFQEIQSLLRDPNGDVLMVQVNNIEETQPDLNSAEYKAVTMEIVKTIRDIIMTNSLIRDNLQQLLGNNLRVNDNPSYLADLAASITSSKPEELQEIMSEENVFSRLKMALHLLMKEKQLLELQQKIGQDVETKIREQHRVFMLREQLKAIKRELGLEKDDKDALAEKYQKLMEGKVIPDAVKVVVDEELQKLGFLDNHSTEFT